MPAPIPALITAPIPISNIVIDSLTFSLPHEINGFSVTLCKSSLDLACQLMPTLKDFSVLIHPGLNGSGPDHWHTHCERAFPDFVRVQQADWDHLVYDARAATRPSPGRRAR